MSLLQRIPLNKIYTCFYYVVHNNIFICINSNDIFEFIFFLRYHSNCLFTQLIDISVIDNLERKNRFEIFYNLRSIKLNARLFITSNISVATTLPSIINIFPNANWYEREVWDMFGIYFTNHIDLRRILTDYGFKGHPLRKDFPMSGYIEVRYGYDNMSKSITKRILYEEVSLLQQYRIFTIDSSWSTVLTNV